MHGRVRKMVLMGLATALGAAGLLVPSAGPATAVQTPQPQLVSDDPANFTPDVVDGNVNAIVQIGNRIFVGGLFTRVQQRGAAAAVARSNLFAFDATTGLLDTTFLPNPDGEVFALLPSPDGQSLYVGGNFNNLGGGGSASLARITLTTGARVGGFRPPTFNGRVRDLRLAGGRLWVAGLFSTVAGRAQTALTTVNPTTGAYDPYMTLPFAGQQNGGTTAVIKMDVTPDGSKLVAIGNFRTVSAANRRQIVMLDLTGPTAALANWQTNFYTTTCSSVFNSYMRDLDISPDGAYFVLSTTGGYSPPPGACDQTSRWETSATGTGLSPSWTDYTGGDTTYAVAVTGKVVYTGGHARWQNNPNGNNTAGPGAVPRPGIAALDPVNGLPLTWNPTRDRGVGVFDLLATSTGLWVGSDTEHIGQNFETRKRLAYFPLAGGKAFPANVTPTLPDDVYLPGQGGAATINRRSYDGTSAGALTAVPAGGRAWSTVRGAFMLNGVLYTGWSDGTFTQQTFDGTTWGTATPVATGDQLTVQTAWHTDVASITGLFFDRGRIYYTLAGSSSLFYRYFTPENAVVGQLRFTASTGVTGLSFSTVNGMFLAGTQLYWSNATGTLSRVDWSGAAPVAGTVAQVSGPAQGVNWASRGLFLFQGAGGGTANTPPVPSFTTACTSLTCTFTSTSTDDGTITGVAWDLGDGTTATGPSVTKTYPASGTRTVTLTVTDDGGASASTSQQVSVTRVNQPPSAAFAVSCSGLTCAVDATGSVDGDGSIASYTWDFGDGATATGVTASHPYATAGARTVTLTVSDNEGATATTTRTASPTSAGISFVGAASSSVNATSFAVTVPAGVTAGDTLLLFFANNDTVPVLSAPSGAGWASLGTSSFSGMVGNGWARPATAADAGSTVRITSSVATKGNLTVMAYRGTSPTAPVAASAVSTETVSGTTHVTPTLTSTGDGGWLVSYWAEKSSVTTTLTPPAAVTARSTVAGTGAGKIISVVGDSNAPVPSGQVGGLSATADQASSHAMMFSVLLAPGA